MRYPTLAVCSLAVLAVGGPDALAQPRRAPFPDPSAGYRWRDEAKKRKLHPDDVDKLARNKLLMTNEAFKQIFAPYVRSDLPLFVTSDSLLNAFHVLFEESVLRLENANARLLPEVLRLLWANLKTVDARITGDDKLTAAAKRRARLVVGVALKLLGDDALKADDPLAAAIDAEARRVTAAEGRHKPEWLGPPDPGFLALDYTRYRPRGFYDRTPPLRRYFRAVSWLQSIPFRIAKDEELLSILMLGNCITYQRFGRDFDRRQEFERFFGRFRLFLGVADDWDLMTAAHHAQGELNYALDKGRLAEERERLKKQAEGYDRGPKVNDQLRFAPLEPGQTAEAGFRILAAYRLPDAVLFQRTTDPRQFRRPAPSGLDVCAALGSSYARDWLPGPNQDRLLKVIDDSKPLFAGSGLYLEYLHCLSALLEAPEADAPPLMSGEPWRVKSCQTVSAGWAQMRHTWALQAKQSAEYLGLTEKPPGFVEPNPEFFSRLAKLVGDTEGTLRRAGALDDGEIGPLWRRLGVLCRRLEALAHKQLRGAAFNKDEQNFLVHYGENLAGVMLYGGNSYLTPRDDAPRVADVSHDPNTGRSLEVGVARARALYVLYPVKGGEILCRGAVLPYYEFQHAAPLTDAGWKELLDGKDRPALPGWIQPLTGRDGVVAPRWEKDE